MWPFPCPWMPATPTRITSLAPSTRPDALVPAMVTSGNTEPAAAARLRKLRRVILFMRLSCGGGKGRHPRLVFERIAYYWRPGSAPQERTRRICLAWGSGPAAVRIPSAPDVQNGHRWPLFRGCCFGRPCTSGFGIMPSDGNVALENLQRGHTLLFRSPFHPPSLRDCRLPITTLLTVMLTIQVYPMLEKDAGWDLQ